MQGASMGGTARWTRQHPGGFTRRGFLGLSVGAASALLLRCSGSHTQPPPTGLTNPFTIWAELQQALRQSPDHLVAAADRLVASKDPAALLAFVRDQIATCPPLDPMAAATEMRWGVPATLRGGIGTPREKAELLVQLYQRAGFSAQVVTATPADSSPSALAAMYFRSIAPPFQPAIDQGTLDHFNAVLGNTGTQTLKSIDPTGSEAAAIASSVSAALPSGLAPHGNPDPTLQFNLLDTIPLVAVQVGGQTVYANPVVPATALGDTGTMDTPAAAPPADAALSVTVRLAASTTTDPTRQVSILEATFAAEDVVGRYLTAQFSPVGPTPAVLTTAARNLRAFLPVLSIRGADVDDATRLRLLRTGTIVTLGGDLVEQANGEVTLNGVPVALPSAADPTASARVASLSVKANAAAFPRVLLSVQALDSSGHPVAGLTSADFAVTDAGTAEPFQLTSTPQGPPRVMLIVDVDDTLDSQETATQWARALTSAVVTALPAATIQVGGGDVATYDLLQDPDAVVAEIGSGDTDDAWRVLADVNQQRPTVIVMASEFNPGPNPLDADKSAVSAGAPVIAVGVNDVNFGGSSLDTATMNEIVQRSGGRALPGAGITASVAAVLDFLQQHQAAQPFILEYTAEEQGPNPRPVTVTVGTRSASDTYAVPPSAQRTTPGALAGLYLTVEVDGVAATRVLAGFSGSTPPPRGTPLAPALLEEVRGMLFGTTFLSIEGGPPPLSIQLDDLLSVKLAIKPLWDAVVSQDLQAMQATLKDAGNLVPEVLPLMQSPLPGAVDGSSLTYPTGLRIVACTQRPQFNVGFTTRLDVLPQTRWSTISADAGGSFQKTLARSASLDVVEAHSATNTAASLLAGQPLMSIPPGDVLPQTLTFVSASRQQELADLLNQYQNHYRVLPSQGFPPAFWAVEQDTGSLLGVLPDGTGGGSSSSACQAYSDVGSLLNLLGFAATILGAEGLAPFVVLGDAVAAVFTMAALMFDVPEGFNADQAEAALAVSILCNTLTGAIGELGGPQAAAASTYIGLLQAIGLTSASCPNATEAAGC
jgi:hypothetical protein